MTLPPPLLVFSSHILSTLCLFASLHLTNMSHSATALDEPYFQLISTSSTSQSRYLQLFPNFHLGSFPSCHLESPPN
ncbi:hypothetical protein GGS23DRAFT_577648 [Durotheca rogersii]|uniref:uncharacterized protein n=1 Tax=Durotheca rogersii TaxID=419775 RepID=UPI00221E4D8E|nr:uncharacterized protein GGS23DRAFT_577648 [Durotheca rogersii]KAI5861229.1 hypothetical protein GGS23DRAFT_577648 [Durotheca rogersii]